MNSKAEEMNSQAGKNISYKAASDLLDMDINVIGNIIKNTSEEIEEITSEKVISKKKKKELEILISYSIFLNKILKNIISCKAIKK